jgi:hypothetical protein
MGTREPFIVTRNRPAAELVEERLHEIPSRFGRLAYLARCLDPHGRYRHDGLQMTHDRSAVDRALADAHAHCFEHWLSLPLEEQHRDFSAFPDGLNRRRVLHAWRETDPWNALAPRTADAGQRQLFASDLRILIAGLLRSL